MDLHKLNPPQREAVTTVEGPLLVLAGAGSGKTRVITHRIAHLLDQGVGARSILAVTFTNKAAAEMKERVVHLAGKRANGVLVATFHAFGAEVLKENLHRLGWPKKFAIADLGDQLGLVKRALRERQVDDRAFDARRLLTLLSRAKNAGKPPEPLPEGRGDDTDLIAHEIYPLYQRGLMAQGAVDFDDLIALPIRLFKELPEVLAAQRRRFRYLLVDEFQDTNESQLELLRLLAGERKNVCAVGDDDQCIYGWRGAEVNNILAFEQFFPGAKEVRLEQNYRSTRPILEVANAVIAKNPARRPKRLWTERSLGERIQVVTTPTEEEEGRYVVKRIQAAVASGIPADEIAILYRTNGQSRVFEEALREKDLRYAVVGGSEFFDRREVKDAIAYLKVIANPNDELSLLRIINTPARGIGDVTMERLLAEARASRVHAWDVVQRPESVPDLPNGAADAVKAFAALISRYRQRFGGGHLAAVAKELLQEVGFAEATRAHSKSAAAAQKRLDSVDELFRSLEAFEKREGVKSSLLTYLNRLSLDTREEEDSPSTQSVALMTLHAAKGLEFRWVFLVGMEEDLLPHKGMQGEPPNLEEERRLCYVGFTRARERLTLTRAATRLRRGKEVPRTPSRFLEDLPAEWVEIEDLTAPPPGPPTEKEQRFFADLKERFRRPEPQTEANGGPPGPKTSVA